MIHFDTNALVALPHWARDRHPLIARVLGGEPVCVCAVVWYEFMSGPLDEEEAELARAFLQGRILSVGEDDAVRAAALFNAAGRRRKLRTDALIAAIAIHADAELATLNTVDFAPFQVHGLRLLPLDL